METVRHNEGMPSIGLILPASTYRAEDFMSAADALDIEIVVISDGRHLIEESAITVDLESPRLASQELASRLPDIDAIVGVDDRGLLVAAQTADLLGLDHNPVAGVAASRNKAMMRRALRETVPQPIFQIAPAGGDIAEVARHVGYPVILKPLGLSGSRGVIRCDDDEQARAAEERIRRILVHAEVDANEPLLVEEFVTGPEIAIEGLLTDGRLEVLAVFDKPDRLDGPFFEETIYVTPSRLHPDMIAEAVRVVQVAVDALGLTMGPVHAELRIRGAAVRLIELAARTIGGNCARALRFGLADTTLEMLVLRSALGMETRTKARIHGSAGVMMIPVPKQGTLAEVRGLEDAAAADGITGIDITIPVGKRVWSLPEASRYLGFIYARGDRPDEVEAALRRAHVLLEFVIS